MDGAHLEGRLLDLQRFARSLRLGGPAGTADPPSCGWRRLRAAAVEQGTGRARPLATGWARIRVGPSIFETMVVVVHGPLFENCGGATDPSLHSPSP